MRKFSATICTVLLAVSGATTAEAQIRVRTQGSATVRVRGVVFDSLGMQPAQHATVWLPGGSQTTVTDDRGRFELDDVPRGKVLLAFSHVGLDSLGLGTMGTQVDTDNGGQAVQLTTPSFSTVWRSLCTGTNTTSATDSGIVWGTIRDASSDLRLHGAAANLSWYEMRLDENKRITFAEGTHQALTDSTGNYYACGVPSEIKISSQATGTRAASGTVEFIIGPRRLNRIDLMVSQDMVLQETIAATTSEDSARALSAKGTSTIRGRVLNAKGKPADFALITVASVDTSVRTNKDGEFVFGGLPAGSQVVQARLIGVAAASKMVDLRSDQTTIVDLRLPDAQTLETVNVKAERVAGRDKVLFDDRQKIGMGYTLREKDLVGRFDVASMVRDMPRVTVRRVPNGNIILLNSGIGQCVPVTYLDGMRSDQEQIMSHNPKIFVAIEVYNSSLTVPFGFEGGKCGTILFWTKLNPRW